MEISIMKHDIKKYIENVSGLKAAMFITTIVFLFLYHQFIFQGYSYIIAWDPSHTYIPQYLHFGEMIRTLDLTLWDFSQGIGNDTFAYTTYYFDVFNLLLPFFNEDNINIFLVLTLFLKFICITYFMYKYLELINVDNKLVKIMFSVIWAFNGFGLLWGQHYFFQTAVVLFTSMIYGLELFLRRKNNFILPISIALVAICGLYLLVPMAIFVIAYIIVSGVLNEEEQVIKKIIIQGIRVGMVAVIAIIVAAPIVFPQIYLLLTSPRTDYIYNFEFFGLNVISQMIGRFFSLNLYGYDYTYIGDMNYWELPNLTSSILVIICFFSNLLNYKNQNKKQKILNLLFFFIIGLTISTNFIGSMTTFFTKSEYRMYYPIIFTMVVISAKYLDKNNINNSKVFKFTLLLVLFSSSVVFKRLLVQYNTNVNLEVISDCIFYSYFVVVFFIWLYSSSTSKKVILLVVTLELIANNLINTRSYNKEYSNAVLEYKRNADILINQVKENDQSEFYRMIEVNYSPAIDENRAALGNYNGTNSYSSLNSPSYLEFAEEMGIALNPRVLVLYAISDTYARENMYDYLGVKYLLDSSTGEVITNEDAFGLGTFYTETISEEFATEQSLGIKSKLLLDYAILDEENSSVPFTSGIDLITGSKSIINQVSSDQITINSKLEDGTMNYTILGDDPKIVYEIQPTKSATVELSIKSSTPGVASIYYGNQENPYSEINKVSLDYTGDGSIVTGVIKVDFDITNVRVDVGNINETIELNTSVAEFNSEVNEKTTMNISSFDDDNIEGNITAEEDGILVFTIPYDKGWSVFANGEELETFYVDFGMTGVYLEEGEYDIELKYENIYFTIGCIVSLVSVSSLVIGIIIVKKLKKDKNKENLVS